jgi:hypothetical protein
MRVRHHLSSPCGSGKKSCPILIDLSAQELLLPGKYVVQTGFRSAEVGNIESNLSAARASTDHSSTGLEEGWQAS